MLTAAVQGLGSPVGVADEKQPSSMTVTVGLALEQLTYLYYPRIIRHEDYRKQCNDQISEIVKGYLDCLFAEYKVDGQDCGKSFKYEIPVGNVEVIETFKKALPAPIKVPKPDGVIAKCVFEINKYALWTFIVDQIRGIILAAEKQTQEKVVFWRRDVISKPFEYSFGDGDEIGGVFVTFKRHDRLDEEIQSQFKKYGIKATRVKHRPSGFNSFLLAIDNFAVFIKQTSNNPATLAPIFASSDRITRETTSVDSENATRALELLLIKKFPENFKDIALLRDINVYIPIASATQKPELIMQYLLQDLGLESSLIKIESQTYIQVNLDSVFKLSVQQKIAEESRGQVVEARGKEQEAPSAIPSQLLI